MTPIRVDEYEEPTSLDLHVLTTHDLDILLARLHEDYAKLEAAYSGCYERPQAEQDRLLMDLDFVDAQVTKVLAELDRRRR
jgi:hypothetical protein